MFCEIPDFGRCCFCLPLRRGVLAFGYINVLYNAFMVGLCSFYIHKGDAESSEYPVLLYKGVSFARLEEFCLALFCLEVIVNCLLVYGAHEKKILYLKIFYYYTMTTCLAALVMSFVAFDDIFESFVLPFTGLVIQLYLIFLVRSLLRKLEQGSSHTIENQLHTIVVGDAIIENGVYNSTTVAPIAKD